jgi:predicted RecB family nuclease
LGAHIGEVCEGILSSLTNNEDLGDKARVSRPDVLIRTDDSPKWAPVDIKLHYGYDDKNQSNHVIISKWEAHLPSAGTTTTGRLKEEDAIQLAHYHQHLTYLGLASDDYLVGIIGREYDTIAWGKLHLSIKGAGKNAPNFLNVYYENFLIAQEIVKKAEERNKDPEIPPPAKSRLSSGKFGCDMCKFRLICRKELENFDNKAGHVSLLAGVQKDTQARHFPDIDSIRDLAMASNLSDIGEKARRRAQVWLSKKPMLVDPAKPLEIPEFDIEVDIDLENSQALLEEILPGELMSDDRVYLYGYGIHDRTKNRDWRSAKIHSIYDFGNTDEAEYNVLSQMWSKLEELVKVAKASGQTIGIFHYSHHEKTWWRNFANRFEGKPNVPTLTHVEDFMSNYFVDLIEFSRKVALPLTGYGVKLLAPHAGFDWSVDKAGGAYSLLRYRDATDLSKPESDRREAQDWLISYNRDDVRATFAVREYLRGLNDLK